MIQRALLLLVAVTAMVWPVLGEAGEQWVYRKDVGGPLAEFRDPSGSSVIFRARCENASTLMLEYFGDGQVPLTGGTLVMAGFALTTTSRHQGAFTTLVGRLSLSAERIRSISQTAEIEIAAPNAAGEPWSTGNAAPLKRLLRGCL